MKKLLILSFDAEEEKMIETMLNTLKIGKDTFALQENIHVSQMSYEKLMIDIERHSVFKNDREISMTYTEFEILNLLAQNPGKVFSKERIYDVVWKDPYYGDYSIVMSHIRHIREKIEDEPSHPIYIQTVWGVGYKFNDKLGSDV